MKLRRWLNDNAFLLALILVVLAVTPGYIRLENNVRDVRDQQEQVEALLEEDQTAQLNRCRIANDSRAQIRQTFHDAFEQLALLGADPELIEQLDSIVPKPEDSDIDCDGNHIIDKGDYGARPG